MASKQLGKLRQWAGEVISSREKTTLSDDFKELERDIEFRREGARRLFLATETYQHYLSKKKLNEALDEAEKLLPIDALGVVMIVHGEEYVDDSVFGSSLVRLGRAHCKVATLQEAFALTLRETFMTFLMRFGEEIKEYDAIRKKLESKRLSYDAAIAKAEKCKNNKKEKDRREAAEELERAQYRYEETLEDVRAHMHAIQENEIAQHRELTGFLDMEINYVQQYLDVLMEVKADWQTKPNDIRRRDSSRSTSSRPQKQTKYSSLRVPSSIRTDPMPAQERRESSDEEVSVLPTRRSLSLRRKSEAGSMPPSAPNSRPGSRAASRTSRNRSDSSVTISEKEKDGEKDKPNWMSVAGWASSAVGSVASIGKKSKDKDRFAELQEDLDANYEPNDTTKTRSPAKLNKQKKIVRALRDFEGSSDELSFKAGDEIIVLNEVLEEWWSGSLNGQTGLFPTTYVKVLSGKREIPDPWQSDSEDNTHAFHLNTYGDGTGDPDEFGQVTRKPLSPHHSPFFVGPSDVMSITSSGHEDEETNLMPKKETAEDELDDSRWGNTGPPPIPMRRPMTTDIHAQSMPIIPSTSASRKSIQPPPPPPPPRRSITLPSMTPPIPDRRLHGLKPMASTSTVSSSEDGQRDYDKSPFESASELAINRVEALTHENPF